MSLAKPVKPHYWQSQQNHVTGKPVNYAIGKASKNTSLAKPAKPRHWQSQQNHITGKTSRTT